MLNSSSNNPGNGNLNGLKAKLSKQNAPAEGVEEEVIIKEEYEPEPDDYNYVPQIREVDEAEIRNLSAVRIETEVDKRVYLASLLFVICALVGAAIGYVWAIMASKTADVNRKASIAKTIKAAAEPKLKDFASFKKVIKDATSKDFSEAAFDATIADYNRFKFMLDMSSDVTTEAVLLNPASIIDKNPLKDLRAYSAKTMALIQLLSVHVNETHADASSIKELLEKKGESETVQFAMQVNADFVYFLATTAPRATYANGVQSIYTFKKIIDDDSEASQIYTETIQKKWSDLQKQRRTYTPAAKEKDKIGDLILPTRMIYDVLDRNGRDTYLFADEVVLVDRSLLFGESANALERYERRNKQIKKLMDEIEEISTNIISDLDSFIGDDK